MNTTFESVADFVLGPPDIPEDVLDMASTLLIDTLGVAAGGVELASGQIARDYAAQFMQADRPANGAKILFDGRTASLPGAAFAAASQIDNLDAHDGYNPVKGHIGCAVVPALLALAPDGMRGRDLLLAMVMAYEVAARAGLALHGTVSDYHTSGAWNALGVTALTARLRGQSRAQLRQGLGIAEYHGPRSQMMREIATPTMLHDGSGMGAMIGIMSALLAEKGFDGAPAITIEGDAAQGYWADLGTRWTLPDNYIKPYPVCRWAHAAIDAAAGLRKAHDIAPAMIASVKIRTFAEAAALFPGMPRTTSEAQYSLPFSVAHMLVHGHMGPSAVDGPALKDPRVAAMIDNINVTEDEKHNARFPEGRWSDVSIVLKDGRVFDSPDTPAYGGPDAPMSLEDVERKFREMTKKMPAESADMLWGFRQKLLNDVPVDELRLLVTIPL